MPRHIRKDDLVIVTAGDDAGRQGKVLRVMPSRQLVVVQGLNIHKKHLKKGTGGRQQGEIVEREMPIHISNVSPVVDGKPTRVQFESKADGSKVRKAAKSGQTIGPELRKAK